LAFIGVNELQLMKFVCLPAKKTSKMQILVKAFYFMKTNVSDHIIGCESLYGMLKIEMFEMCVLFKPTLQIYHLINYLTCQSKETGFASRFVF